MATIADEAMEVAAEVVHESPLGVSISMGWLSSMVVGRFEEGEGRRLQPDEETQIQQAVTNLGQDGDLLAKHNLWVHWFRNEDATLLLLEDAQGWEVPISSGIEGAPKVLVSKINPPLLEPVGSQRYPLSGRASEVEPQPPASRTLFEHLAGHLIGQGLAQDRRRALEEPVAQVLRRAGFQLLPGRNIERPHHLQPVATSAAEVLGVGWSDYLAYRDGGLVNFEVRNRSREIIGSLAKDRERFERLAEAGIPSVLVTARASHSVKEEIRTEYGGAVIEINEFLAPSYEAKVTLDRIGMPWPIVPTSGPGPWHTQLEMVAVQLVQASHQMASEAVEGIARAMALAAATADTRGPSAKLERGRPRSREASREKVLALRAEGLSQAEIARQMGNSERWVRELVKGERAFSRGRPTRKG